MPDCGINQLVDVRQGKGVLRAGLVEVCEVYADSSLPVLFLDYDDIG